MLIVYIYLYIYLVYFNDLDQGLATPSTGATVGTQRVSRWHAGEGAVVLQMATQLTLNICPRGVSQRSIYAKDQVQVDRSCPDS